MKKIITILKNINNRYFFGRYTQAYNYINKKSSFKDYLFKFILIYLIIIAFIYLIFVNAIYCTIIAFVITIFLMNEIILNSKKLVYEQYILSQLTIYTSQMSMLITFNNVFSSLKEVTRFLDTPVKDNLLSVIKNIESGKKIGDAFQEFNEKYNNRTITLFNQTLELFDTHGQSDAGIVLHIISEEMNMLKIKKDKFHKFKKEWRINFYVVVFLCMSMPIVLKLMIPTIYEDYMNSFGTILMIIIIIANLVIIKKIESVYRDDSVGEGGYK